MADVDPGDRTRMELVILGAGPAYSDLPGAVGSSYLVRTHDAAVVLDLGHGTFSALVAAWEPSALGAVLISHLHPDHFVDLVPLRHYLCRAEFDPSRRLRVLAPSDLHRRLDGLYDQPGFSVSAFDLEEPPDGPLVIGPFVVTSTRVRHAAGSRAWRVAPAAGGAGVTYTGDAGDPDELAALLSPGDLLLSEATFGPGPVPAGMNHLDGPSVGRLAARGEAGQVVLTHIRMGCDVEATVRTVRATYPGPVAVARPGARFGVPAGPARPAGGVS